LSKKKKNSGETAAHRDLRKRLVSHEMLYGENPKRGANTDGANPGQGRRT